jgi:hypothetical protein
MCPMRYLACLLVSLGVGVLSQALADEPPQPAPVQSTPASSASPAAVSTPPAASAAKTESPKQVDVEAQTKRLRGLGYRPETRNGRLFYCRKETPVGSRFENKICGTADELDKAAQNSKELVETIQRQNSMTPRGN